MIIACEKLQLQNILTTVFSLQYNILMKSFNYHPFTRTLTLHFVCPECEDAIDSNALDVPPSKLTVEKASDSENYDDYDITCPNCGWTSKVSLFTRYDGGYGEVEGLEEESTIEVDEE